MQKVNGYNRNNQPLDTEHCVFVAEGLIGRLRRSTRRSSGGIDKTWRRKEVTS
jgi:hypothetical protein